MRIFWMAFAVLFAVAAALWSSRGGPLRLPLLAPRAVAAETAESPARRACDERPIVVVLTAAGRTYFLRWTFDLTSPSVDDREEATEALLGAIRHEALARSGGHRTPPLCIACEERVDPAHVAWVWEVAGLVQPPIPYIRSVARRPAPDREE